MGVLIIAFLRRRETPKQSSTLIVTIASVFESLMNENWPKVGSSKSIGIFAV